MLPPGFTGKLKLLTSSIETKLCIVPLSTKQPSNYALYPEAASPQDSVQIPFHAEEGTGFQLALAKQEQLCKHEPFAPQALCTRMGNLNKCAVDEVTER